MKQSSRSNSRTVSINAVPLIVQVRSALFRTNGPTSIKFELNSLEEAPLVKVDRRMRALTLANTSRTLKGLEMKSSAPVSSAAMRSSISSLAVSPQSFYQRLQ